LTPLRAAPFWRKVTLTAHVMTSVGWLGAVAAFLALAIVGLRSSDTQMVRSAYIATESVTWLVIVPLAFASLLTGLVVSLTTQWGLFRYYWVIVKLIISVLAATLLLVHTRPIGMLADAARGTAFDGPHVSSMQLQVVIDAAAAITALMVNVILSVFKPQGMTPYGWRKSRAELTA
jgi:hypothetical protein